MEWECHFPQWCSHWEAALAPTNGSIKKLSLGGHTQKEDMVVGGGFVKVPSSKGWGRGEWKTGMEHKIMKILYVNVWSSQTTTKKKLNNLKEGTGNADKRALEYWEKPTRNLYVQKFNIVKLKEHVLNNTGRMGGEYQWMETNRIIILWLCCVYIYCLSLKTENKFRTILYSWDPVEGGSSVTCIDCMCICVCTYMHIYTQFILHIYMHVYMCMCAYIVNIGAYIINAHSQH